MGQALGMGTTTTQVAGAGVQATSAVPTSQANVARRLTM